ncbi:MAG: molybdopterin-containing oxidoreductase family protein [Planctomycetota bacterium]
MTETRATAETRTTAETRATTCNRDCPDACAILVDLEDGRPVRLRGAADDPVTRGFLCERTSRFLTRQNDPARFLRPMLRRGAWRRAAGVGAPLARDEELVPISWNEALDLAAEKLRAISKQSGPAAILHYRSGGSLGLLKVLSDLLFERFGPVSVKRGDICSGGGESAQERDFGICESHDLFDLLHSRTIVLWGKNVHTSSVHLLPVLAEARRAGARILGIDPVRTRAAEVCEHFVQPRPGADFALAMGVARWLLERGATDPRAGEWCDGLPEFMALAQSRSVDDWAQQADVSTDDVAVLAEAYGQQRPAAILVGWGLARRRNGAATVRALDALAALTGNLGVPGGGVSYYFRRRSAFETSFLRGLPAAPRSFAETSLGADILAAREPPVRAIWVTAGNPVSMLPDSGAVRRAFLHSEFNVVVDTHPTDTTDVADLVLPTLTLLEDSDLLGAFGNHFLRLSQAAVTAPLAREALDPESEGPRHELHILQGLARRLGPEVEAALAGSVDEWKSRLLARTATEGVDLPRLRQGAARNPFATQVLFAGRRVPTPNGRVQLLREAAAPPPQPSANYPLTLLACSTPKAQSSQWSTALPPGPAELRVHPDMAAAAGVADGAEALLESRLAALTVRVRCDATLRRDVASMDKGGMLRDGRCANLLVPAVETDLGGGAAYYDELVRLRAVPVE